VLSAIRGLKRQEGQSMVEFALIIPVLLLIVIGIIEFGFMFGSYLSLTNASREAVRYVSLGGTDAAAETRAKEVAIILVPDRMRVTISPSNTLRNRGDSVSVDITYDYEFLTPFMNRFLGNSVTLRSKATMRVE
jgi:uncharacterized protein (UPF0333 family)